MFEKLLIAASGRTSPYARSLRPSVWEPRVWEYEDASFIAAQVSSRALAAALDPDDAQVLPLGGFNLTIPRVDLAADLAAQAEPCRYDSVLLSWPTQIFDLHLPGGSGGQRQHPYGFLIGDDCPSFPSYDAAFRAFFYGDSPARLAAASPRTSPLYASSTTKPGWTASASLPHRWMSGWVAAQSSARGSSSIARRTDAMPAPRTQAKPFCRSRTGCRQARGCI
jgi:hypothetical protein